MVIDIALGILLALIIVAMLPYLIALGIVAISIGLVVLVVGGLFVFFSTKPAHLIAIAVAAGFGVAFYGTGMLIHRRWNHIAPKYGAGLAFAIAIWVLGVITVIGNFDNYASQQYPIPILLVVGGAVGFLSFLLNRKLLLDWRERQSKNGPQDLGRVE